MERSRHRSGARRGRIAYATALLKANVHPKIVSESLGHSSIVITMDTYSHVLPSIGDVAAEALQRTYAGVLPTG